MTVAITGIGLVCPAGIGLQAALDRLAQGPLVPARPDGPEGDAMPDPPILPVPAEFDPRPVLKRRKDRKLMARANELAVVAAHQAAAAAGLLDALADAGLYLGVGREPGNLDDILPVLAHSETGGRFDGARLVAEGMGHMNPLSSLKTLPNMSVAHVAINLGILGPGQALTDDAAAGTRALLEAATAVAAGLVPWALAGGADSRVAFTDRSTARRLGQPGPLGEAAAVFVLEPAAAARARGAHILGYVGAAAPGTPAPSHHLGDCGAGTDVAALALALGRGQASATGGVQVAPTGAPALHLRREAAPIAITGVGGVTPLGHDFATFTRRLLAGESAVAPIRGFDVPGFPVHLACEVVDAPALPDALAAAFAGLDDRKGELAVGAALAAVADHGGLPPEAGLVYATGLSSVSVAEIDQDSLPFLKKNGEFDYAAFAKAPPRARPQAPARHLVTRPADLVAAHLGLTGPRAQHFSACAAGAAAIAHAAELIRRGEAEVMLAGGADSMVHPFGLLPFILLGATTTETQPHRAGRPFEADRDGFVMGEGGAFFVLEPLARARAAGRPVHGLLLGAGSSNDAWNVTAPHPEGLGAERAMRAALADAGLPPEVVGYVNAHGTGTPLNDGVEAAAVARVCGRPPISSSKAQFGHTIAAAGAVELLACLAAFRGGRLPPNAHLTAADPALDLDLVEATGRAGAPGVILSNSFGFGGQNAALVLGHPDHGRST
ncbi:MAG: hypothetical protein H6706_03990 [Myxococcales bacterium]|nr:hypothetical protein [Myxococcales bacterium]